MTKGKATDYLQRVNKVVMSKRNKRNLSSKSETKEFASRTIKRSQIMELTVADQQAFVNALLNSPEPSKELKRAAKRYKSLGLA